MSTHDTTWISVYLRALSLTALRQAQDERVKAFQPFVVSPSTALRSGLSNRSLKWAINEFGPNYRDYYCNRLIRNKLRSWEVSPCWAKSAIISPTTLQYLKPWPEKPAATLT